MNDSHQAPEPERGAGGRSFFLLSFVVGAVAVLVFVLRLLPFYSGLPAWDDAYMFVRYARQLATTGAVAWNPDGVPVYGLTSLLYFAVVVPIDRLLPNDPTTVLILADTLLGVGFLILFVLGAYRLLSPTLPARSLLVSGLIAYILLRTEIPTFFANGMDTMLAMFYVLAYALALIRWERSGGRGTPHLALALGVLGFLVRPDMLILTFGTPALMLVLGWRHSIRWGLVTLIAGMSAGTLAILGFTWIYFGTPVPLSFFAKTVGYYGPWIDQFYRKVGYAQAINFVTSTLPLLAIILLGRPFSRRALRVEGALLLAALAFGAYYTVAVLQIMGNQSRFYFPLLPIILLLAALGIDRILLDRRDQPRPFPLAWRVAPRLLMTYLALDFVLFASTTYAQATYPQNAPFVGPRPVEARLARLSNFLDEQWPGVFQLRQLPAEIRLAATEVGVPGVLNPEKSLLDLAGLNSQTIGRGQETPRQALERTLPDFVYFPHPDSVEMIADIMASQTLHREYLILSSDCLSARLAIGVLRSSPYYADLVQAVSHRRSGGDRDQSC